MTKVIREISARIAALFLLAVVLSGPGSNAFQQPSVRNHGPGSSELTKELTKKEIPESAEALYDQLGRVGLDRSRVYKARDIALDRTAIHISLDDGTIAFTEDVAGRVTGAFFEGEGDVLLAPPEQVERASMARFTGAAILEEKFGTAYFRFNDSTFQELEPLLRPADDTDEFIRRWNDSARNLAEGDALRLLLSFSRLLPVKGEKQTLSAIPSRDDRMLHARVQGQKLGTFDLYYDTNAGEQIWAGQSKTVEGISYYDVWSSFSPKTKNQNTDSVSAVSTGENASQSIAITHCKIQAVIKPPQELEAQASLQLEIRQGGQRAVLFELSRFLRIQRVEAAGRALEFIHNQALEGTQLARRGNDLMAVIFPEPLRAGQTVSLDFTYGGEVLSEAGGGLLYVGARGTWYPNRGLGMSDFDLTFRYPSQWTLIATGKKMDPASASDKSPGSASPGEQTSHWISERPIPVAGFNLGRYSRAAAHSGKVLVETYAAAGVERSFPKGTSEEDAAETLSPSGLRRQPERPMIVAAPPPSPARHAQSVAEQSARALSFYSNRFGPYPYSTLALTQIPGGLSQGWPSLIFLSSFSFLTTEEKSQLHMSPLEKILSNGVIAHETAHQWWGDLLTWKSYRDQWMMEALANYSSLMLLEMENPMHFRAVMDKYREDLLSKNKEGSPFTDAGPVTLGVRLTCSHFPAGYETISYGRGTWLMHMLRSMMRDAEVKHGGRRAASEPSSDDAFVRALFKLRQRYQGGAISTHDLLQVLEEDLPPSLWYEGKRSLDWFYRSWVNGTSVPRLELQSVKYSENSGTTTVTATILQKDAPNNLVTSVPVYGVLGSKAMLLGRVFADGRESSFHLPAPTGIRKIVLDPYQTVLARPK